MKLYIPSIIVFAIAILCCSCNGKTSKSDSATSEDQAVVQVVEINGHEYVDLGLPSGLKWATCNIGANSQEEFGDYFAWGETNPKSIYTEKNCEAYKKSYGWLIANDYVDEYGNLLMEYDAARQNWGGTWRMPTKRDIKELESWTFAEWTTIAGVNGVKVVSKKNGKSIFMPACGWQDQQVNHEDDDKKGIYWGSSCNPDKAKQSIAIYFTPKGFHADWRLRCRGYVIRPVSE